MLFLLSLFPWFRHDSAKGQPLFSAGNIHVAGRCSDYRFFIDHLRTGVSLFHSIFLLLCISFDIHEEIYSGKRGRKILIPDEKIRNAERMVFEFRRILETKNGRIFGRKSRIQIATIILHFPPSSYRRSRIEIWKMEGLSGRLGGGKSFSRGISSVERELGSCARHKRRRARFAADRSRSCRAASSDVQIVGRLLKTNKCSLLVRR